MKQDFEGSSVVSAERDAYIRFRREMLASHYLTLNDDRRRRAVHLQDTIDMVRAMAAGTSIAAWWAIRDERSAGQDNGLGGGKV